MPTSNARYFFLSIALIAVFVGGAFFSYYRAYERVIVETSSYVSSELKARDSVLQTKLEELKNDVLFLQSVPPIQGIVRATQNGGIDPLDNSSLDIWKKRLSEIFRSYLASSEGVFQVRYIGVAENGRELVRADKKVTGVKVVPEQKLQSKGDRSYFKEISRPDFDGIYYSDISLNRENGQLQFPHVPTIRLAIKVFDEQGNQFGIIILNYDVEHLFTSIAQKPLREARLFLLNEQHDFLSHPDENKTFGMEFGKPYRWEDEFTLRTSTQPDQAFQRVLSDDEEYVSWTYRTKLGSSNKVLTWNSVVSEASIINRALLSAVNTIVVSIAVLLLLLYYFYLYRSGVKQREMLSLEKARNSSIVEGSQDAIIGVSMEGEITDWNWGASVLFGYSKDEAIGATTQDILLLPDVFEEEAMIRNELAQGNNVKPYESVRKCKDGRLVDVSVSASPIRDEAGTLIGVSKIIRDITELKEASDKIEEMNRSLEQQVKARTQEIIEVSALQKGILDNAAHAIIATDPEGLITLFNPAAEKMLGYTAEEMVGKLTPAAFHLEAEVVERAQEFSKELGQVIEPGFDVFVIKSKLKLNNEHEWTYVRKDKTELTVYLSVTALYDDKSNITGYLGLATDISELVENRRVLENTKDHLAQAAEVAQLGIWSWEVQSGDLKWNNQMFEIYGLNQEEIGDSLNYAHWNNALLDDQREEVSNQLERALKGETTFDPIFQIRRPSGDIRHVQAIAVVERDAFGEPMIVLGINRDITEQVQYENKLKEAKQAAELASQTKSEFVANMSHEIRTPMNAVIGLLELLKKTHLDNRQEEYVDKSEAAAKSLLRILNDILDFSKIEAGRLEIDPHPFQISNLIDDLATVLSANIKNKSIELVINVDARIPDYVVLDSLRLEQVVLNLAGNAIKFTEKGFVKILIGHEESATEHRLTCTVQDTGIGIDPQHLETIFDEFSQAEASTVRRFGGTGLGLAISKSLVELMGGHLSVESTLNQGSAFSFSIPYQSCGYTMDVPKNLDLRRLNVLVVDDLPEARDAMKNVVESLGWRCVLATSGAEALALLGKTQDKTTYDLVLMDWEMPELNGWDTSLQIRALPEHQNVPKIFIVTAYGNDLNLSYLQEHKNVIEGIIEKPLSPSTLVNRCTELFLPSGPIKQPDKVENKRLPGLRVLLVEDVEVNRLVANELLTNEGAQVTEAEDGIVALDILNTPDQAFDIVLMDIQMPRLDGYETTRRIRQDDRFDHLPIMAMTANVMASDQQQAKDAGMNDHIGKPFDLEDLVLKIQRLTHRDLMPSETSLGSNEKDASTTAHTATSRTTTIVESSTKRKPDEQPLLAIDDALFRFSHNKAIYGKTLEAFVNDAAGYLDQLPETWLAGSQEAVIASHTLKGLSATIGAQRLSAQAFVLEKMLKAEAEPQGYQSALETLRSIYQETNQQLAPVKEEYLPHASLPSDDSSDTALPLEPEALKQKMMTLSELLHDANMEAFQVLKPLQQHADGALAEQLSRLGDFMNDLNFKEAARICDQWLDQLTIHEKSS